MVRKLAFLLLAPIFTATGCLVAFVLVLFTPRSGRAPHAVGRAWARSILFAAGVKLEVEGGGRFAPDEPRVFAANHSSYLDIPAVLLAFPGQLRVVARKNLALIPFLGWYLKLCGHLLIDRDDPRQGLELFASARTRMARDHLSVLVFPEGTRSRDGRLAPLKGGAFHLAASLGAPLQPVAIFGTFAVMPKGTWAPGCGGTARVRIGAPIATEGLSGGPARRKLGEQVQAALVGLGLELSDSATGSASAASSDSASASPNQPA